MKKQVQKFDPTIAINPSGVILNVLFKDSKSIDIDIENTTLLDLVACCTRCCTREIELLPISIYNVYHELLGKNTATEKIFDQEGYNKAILNLVIIRQTFMWGLFYLTDTMDNPKVMKAWAITQKQVNDDYNFYNLAEKFEELLCLIKD